MATLMSIGDFSRATRLSAKALRFYHQAGLLVPTRVDPGSGYRLYGVDQIADAQLIRSYRSLDMPIDLIRGVLSAQTTAEREGLIAGHLANMEAQLEATRSAVAALRSILRPSTIPFHAERRTVPPTPAVVISETIELRNLGRWYVAAMAELDRVVASGVEPEGPRGGIWATELFLDERGEAALFFPVRSLEVSVAGRARAQLLPAVDLVVARHDGTDDTLTEVYAQLGRHVVNQGISADGPIRETYLTTPVDARRDMITEIGWPVLSDH